MEKPEKDTVRILSIKVSKLNLDQTVGLFINWIENKQKKRICVTPVNCILWARKIPRLKNIYNTSDMNLPDGVPLIWASKLFNNPISGRVTGLDLLPEFAKIASQKKYTFFFLGGGEGVAEVLSDTLKKRYPNLLIVGTYCPTFSDNFSDEENNKIIEAINATQPNVLWVGLTAPKQDYWIYDNFDKLNINIAIGVGGAFDVSAGLIKRAPVWMQKNGLEWFYRFTKDPKRLFKRYIIEAPLFIPLIIFQKLGWIKNNN